MAISNKQRITMAVIVLIGLLAGGTVLMTDGANTGDRTAEPAQARHTEPEEHAAEGKTGHREDKPDAHAQPQVELNDAQRRAAGIALGTAGPATLRTRVPFQGEIRFNDDRTSHIVPRLAGVAEAVPATLGQVVGKGQVLAVIASTALSEQRSELLTAQKRRELATSTYEREKKLWDERISAQQDLQQAQSALQEADIAVQNARQKLAAVGANELSGRLNRFEIRAPFAGTLVEKHLSLGESAKEDASIFTVSDLSSVWAEFAVAPKDLAAVRVGQRVVVSSTAFEGEAEGTISYVGALLGEQSRTARARATLANPAGAWRPGLFVTVAVLGEDRQVPLAVPADALQTIDQQPMLFIAASGGFTARPVQIGHSDGKTVEIVGGLQPGDTYAASNTFVLKSELGKASAGHGH